MLPTAIETAAPAEQTVATLFGTPFLRMLWSDSEDLNRRLHSLILAEEACAPSIRQSNFGGWQSEKRLHEWPDPAIQEFVARIDHAVRVFTTRISKAATSSDFGTWRISAWANVNRATHYNATHYHVGGFWSGVYYVTGGKSASLDAGAGVLALRNPSASHMHAKQIRSPQALQDVFRHELRIRPAPGLLVMFPSWIEHYVTPHFDEEPRISIAFDISY